METSRKNHACQQYSHLLSLIFIIEGVIPCTESPIFQETPNDKYTCMHMLPITGKRISGAAHSESFEDICGVYKTNAFIALWRILNNIEERINS